MIEPDNRRSSGWCGSIKSQKDTVCLVDRRQTMINLEICQNMAKYKGQHSRAVALTEPICAGVSGIIRDVV